MDLAKIRNHKFLRSELLLCDEAALSVCWVLRVTDPLNLDQVRGEGDWFRVKAIGS